MTRHDLEDLKRAHFQRGMSRLFHFVRLAQQTGEMPNLEEWNQNVWVRAMVSELAGVPCEGAEELPDDFGTQPVFVLGAT